jgi:hypothetical protein
MKDRAMKTSTWWSLGLCTLLVLSTASAAAAQKGKPDLKKVRDEMGIVQSVLDQALVQTFGEPFGYLEKAKGVYLPGFGVVFSFEINLTPSGDIGPFSGRPTVEGMKAQKEEAARRLEKAKTVAQNTLADFGHTLADLDSKDSVAIVIYSVAVQPSGLDRNTIVMQCDKQLIDSYRKNSVDRAAFLRKLTVLEY